MTDYTWDVGNRLVAVTDRASVGGTPTEMVTYSYDAEGRWIGQTISIPGQAVQQTSFAYDGNEIALEFDGTGTSPLTVNNLSHRYLWNPAAVDQLFADEQLSPASGGGYDVTTPGQTVWTLTDNQNTVRDLAVYNTGTNTTAL